MTYDIAIIGTGAGGATVARELSKKGLKVLILEKGKRYPVGKSVNHIKNIQMDLKLDLINENKENYEFLNYPAELMYIEDLGGTTPVSLANACYACSNCYSNSATNQFKIHGIDLFKELIDASADLKVSPFPADLMGPATCKIVDAGENIGFFMEPMPKFIDFSKCDGCGLCINGCKINAKWDATHFINEALENGATLISDFIVTKINHNKKELTGIEGISGDEIKKFKVKKVILAAGALNTPQILKNSGITENVGEGLFCDLFITIGGYIKDINFNKEIPMGVKSEFGPYFLSPHFSNQLIVLLKNKGFNANPEDVIGIMIKIADEANGKLNEDKTITKPLTERDLGLLKEGYEKSEKLLVEIGVDPSSIVSTHIRGAHPGGTAAMGKVVDKNLETEIKGLFIADASVIPQAPGRPPILTITALAKKLANNIVQDIQLKKKTKI
ncbi:MAG: GMC family oxidoreductase [Methanobacterium sp.]|uniref:GMC family oxidoreductase N-terminal domain-containing protein n=1 Tax=Methanobacterium sp. TaxID=2164 RepID=UPI003D64904E|nr:GMC family oxidoreductase [Methanobacterium sp.]